MTDLWDIKRVAQFLGMSLSTFYKRRHDPDFPSPIAMPGRPKWRAEDWYRWIDERNPNKAA
jgi:predicted DNA-binding transcriptional regulator AlpA